MTINLSAGNPDRVGSAGASQLLINPWARSSGWGGANIASVNGLESLYGNVAGLSHTEKTEIIFSRTSWIADIPINAFGFSQRLNESSVLALAISSISLADIVRTTELLPDGGLGTYTISATNVNVAYSKTFSNSIYGGFVFKTIFEGTSDVSAGGVALDAGIQYITGKSDHIKFGIALKNIGPTMVYDGDGISFRGQAPDGEYTMTLEQRTDAFELPSLLNIGVAYDLPMLPENHRLSTAGTFTSNSFKNDQFRVGLEYSFKELVMIRGGYVYENEISEGSVDLTGPTAGFTVELPLTGQTTFGLDYSLRPSEHFGLLNTIGVRIDL
ncbi:MAG: PorV/PorQ family protein [Flavobacteriales bacterium]